MQLITSHDRAPNSFFRRILARQFGPKVHERVPRVPEALDKSSLIA
jgi:hypothetical protein